MQSTTGISHNSVAALAGGGLSGRDLPQGSNIDGAVTDGWQWHAESPHHVADTRPYFSATTNAARQARLFAIPAAGPLCKQPFDGVRSGTEENERDGRTCNHEVVLIAAGLCKEAALPMDTDNAHDHDSGDSERGQPREQPPSMPSPPKNSVIATTSAHNNPGTKPMFSNPAAVPSMPRPPNAPKSF